MTKIACNNIYFAYITKKDYAKNGFSERLSTIGTTILRSYTANVLTIKTTGTGN
jgi:hypothetical protein